MKRRNIQLRSWIRRRRKGVRVTAYDAAKSAVHRASCPDNIVTLCSNQEPVRGLGHSLSPPPQLRRNLSTIQR